MDIPSCLLLHVSSLRAVCKLVVKYICKYSLFSCSYTALHMAHLAGRAPGSFEGWVGRVVQKVP